MTDTTKLPENKNDPPKAAIGAPKADTTEAGAGYTGDGAVVGVNDSAGAEVPLVDAPEDFVEYGGASDYTGSGLRGPGAFRSQFSPPGSHFRNLEPIPFMRFQQ